MKRFLRVLTFALLLILCVSGALTSCTGTGNSPQTGAISVTEVNQADGVLSVTLGSKGTKLNVRTTLSSTFIENHPRATVYLYELPVGADASLLCELEPVYSFRVSAKGSWSAPLFEGSLSRLYCSYVLAQKDEGGTPEAIGLPIPVLNPEALSTRNYAYPEALSIKGIRTSSSSDALSLGSSHVVLDVSIDDFFIIPDPANPTAADEYVHNGITYHFNTAALADLDGKVRTLSNEAVIVYFRFLLDSFPATLAQRLLSQRSTDKTDVLDDLNIYNENYAEYLAAFFEFFAERYTRPSGEHGFCGSFIIGSDINNPEEAVAACFDSESYTLAYARLVRTARTALVSNYSYGKVYISLGNNWGDSLEGAPLSTSSYAFLASFSAINSARGDYNWSVAVSAYALDPANSSIWNDSLASGASSQYLSPANVNVLTYAMSKNYTFIERKRDIIICAFGVSGNPTDANSLSSQAASYAYAYYKVASDGDVSALIYSDLTAADDTTLNYSLYSGGTRKPIWNVFASIDTKDDNAAVNAAVLAGSEFSYMYSNISEAVKAKITYSKEGFGAKEENYRKTELFNFSQGNISDFRVASPLTGLDLYPWDGTPTLHIYSSGNSGIIRTGISSSLLVNAENILVDIPYSDSAGKLTLRLSQNGDNGQLSYEASAAYFPGNQLLAFDIVEFADALSRGKVNISLWFNPEGELATSEILISSISTADNRTSTPPILLIIFLSLLVFFLLLMLIAFFSRFYHRSRQKTNRSRNQSSGGKMISRDDT